MRRHRTRLHYVDLVLHLSTPTQPLLDRQTSSAAAVPPPRLDGEAVGAGPEAGEGLSVELLHRVGDALPIDVVHIHCGVHMNIFVPS